MGYKGKTTLTELKRIFFVAKAVMIAAPVICLLYVSMKASMNGVTVSVILNNEAGTTILLVNSLLNIYVTYLLHLAQNNLAQGKQLSAVTNMLILLFTQLLSRNIFGFFMLAFVSQRSFSFYEISIKETVKNITLKQLLFNAGGSLIIVFLNCITLFATIKIM